jgi:hypothetical protein
MPTNYPTRTRPARFNPLSDGYGSRPGPYKPGDIPAAWHTFHDFAIPRTTALVSPVNEYGMRYAMVYTPNPWVATEIRFYEWILGSENIWRRSRGGTFKTIELARLDYTKVKAQGWTPQDVIANPLNGELYLDNVWDTWACHFSGMTQQFYRIIPIYNNTYPRKAV